MKKVLSALPLALFLAACAGGSSGGAPPEPQAPPPLDPVGVYDCLVEIEGMQLPVTATITGTKGAYAGSFNSEMGLMQMSDIVVEDNRMTFVVDRGDMGVFVAVLFEGEAFTGEVDAGGMAGYISGKKR